MPSVPESGNGSVVESKPRPNALKLPEAAKYTDVTRTSSASFKPPMSKDPVLKKKADVPQADSSWFGPLSYIKNMFGGKPAAESSNQVTSKIDKNKKIPTTKNTSNVSKPHVAEAKEEIEEVALVSEEHTQPSVVSEPVAPAAPAKIEHSPRFSFTPDEASGRRVVKEKVVTKKVEPEEEIDPNAPKYNALRFVENKSTYLHTPDKKGTTSFRITTSSKVKTKPNPALMSPNFGNAASKRMRRSPAMSRQSSASPKKIPQTDSTTNFPTRLRSKSTPDHASIKPRPVSDPTCPKSLSLKSNSQKNAPESQNDVNENRAEVTYVKPPSKLSIPNKPTVLGESKSNTKVSKSKSSSRSSKSSLQIGQPATPPNVLQPTRCQSAGDNRVVKSNNQDSIHSTPTPPETADASDNSSKPNAQRPAKQQFNAKFQNTKRSKRDKISSLAKDPPPAESPTFTQPTMVTINKIVKRTQTVQASDAITKFTKAQQRAKDKMKTKSCPPPPPPMEENKIQAHQMVLPATIKGSPTLGSKSGRVVNSETNSPKSKIVLRRGNPGSISDISSTIADSPVRRPSPPGVMCLTGYAGADKKNRGHQEENKRGIMDDKELIPTILVPSFAEPSRSPPSSVSTYNSFHTSASNSPTMAAHQECDNEIMRYVEQRKDEEDDEEQGFYPEFSEPTVHEDIYHASSEYRDMSNSACRNGDDTADYKIDVFNNESENEEEDEEDTCNSALPRKSIAEAKSPMKPTCMISESEDNTVYEAANGAAVIVQRDKNRKDFIPFERNIVNESVAYLSDKSPLPTQTSSAVVAKKKAAKSDVVTLVRDSSKERQRGSEGGRRRYPFDVDTEKIKSLTITADDEPKINRTPRLSTSPVSNRLHPSPFLRSPSKKPGDKSNYLEAVNRPVMPSIHEPTVYYNDDGRAVPVRHGSPSRSAYYRSSPNITLGSIAASVGDAFDSIAESVKKTLPSVTKITGSPEKTSKPKDGSPTKSEMKPTQIVEHPHSATMTYISTVLEDNGISPSLWNKSSKEKGKKKIPTGVEEKSPDTLLTSSSPVSKIPSSPGTRNAAQNKKIDGRTSPKKMTYKYTSNAAPEAVKPPTVKNNTKEKKQPVEAEPNIVAKEPPAPQPAVPKEPIENTTPVMPVTDRIRKTVEDTKNFLSLMFSPPKKTMPKKLPKEPEPEIPAPPPLPVPTPEVKTSSHVKPKESRVEIKSVAGGLTAVSVGKPPFDSDPSKWPTITKPGFQTGKAADMIKQTASKGEPEPKVSKRKTAPSPVAITAHALQQKSEAPKAHKSAPTPPPPAVSNNAPPTAKPLTKATPSLPVETSVQNKDTMATENKEATALVTQETPNNVATSPDVPVTKKPKANSPESYALNLTQSGEMP